MLYKSKCNRSLAMLSTLAMHVSNTTMTNSHFKSARITIPSSVLSSTDSKTHLCFYLFILLFQLYTPLYQLLYGGFTAGNLGLSI